ncbi:hypothetical protein ACJX0J_019272, partial [Zea mays]
GAGDFDGISRLTRLVKVAFVAFDFFRVCIITVEKWLIVRVAQQPRTSFWKMREGGYDVHIFLCYCINFGLYHNFLCRIHIYYIDIHTERVRTIPHDNSTAVKYRSPDGRC